MRPDNSDFLNELGSAGSLDQSGVDIVFWLREMQMVLHQPIVVGMSVKNNLRQPLQLNLGPNRTDAFIFDLQFPDGRKIRLPRLSGEGLVHPGLIQVLPKQEYAQSLLLNQWTDFPIHGKYILTVLLANEIKTANGKRVNANRTFKIEFMILERNKEVIETISNNLVQRILNSDSRVEISRAARELSYIDDPVAIPYLQKAMIADERVALSIIDTFIEKGGKVSVDVLICILTAEPDSKWRSMAESALKIIEFKSSDVNLKQRIKDFLKY